MTATNPMKSLYRRLSQVGLTRPFVTATALPEWWDDSIAAKPAGYAQLLLLLSRHLGLELRSLQEADSPIRLRDFGECKFKKRADVTEDELALARVMATRAAQLAAEAVSRPVSAIPRSGLDIRQQIIDNGRKWVGLQGLLKYCWSVGVPVLHLDHFPKNARRPDGFAAIVKGRPVIVLCRKVPYSAWLLFILAHELGHIALKHISEEGTLLDDRMDESSEDQEEQQANAFALELLTGDCDRHYVARNRWPNAEELAKQARMIGRERKIDPGHIVLNYSKSRGNSFWGVGMAALKILDPQADAIGIVRKKMEEELDWSFLPEDSSEFLMKVTQHGQKK